MHNDLESAEFSVQSETEHLLESLDEAQREYRCLVQPVNELIVNTPSGTPLGNDEVRMVRAAEAMRIALEDYERAAMQYLDFLHKG